MSLPYIGIPIDPTQIPQQMLAPPPEMVIDVLGIRVPSSMLESGYFWLFMASCAVMILGVAWIKYRRSN